MSDVPPPPGQGPSQWGQQPSWGQPQPPGSGLPGGPPPPGGFGNQFPQSPATPYGASMGTKPDNFLVWSILATLFCCLPFGIAGIVFASQVDSKWTVGDYQGAQRAAKNARTWTFVSVGVGLVTVVLYLIFVVAVGVGGTTY